MSREVVRKPMLSEAMTLLRQLCAMLATISGPISVL